MMTPDEQLLQAATAGDAPGVAQALALGAAVDTRNAFGATPLFLSLIHI